MLCLGSLQVSLLIFTKITANNLAPADVYFNRGAKILKQREEIKHLVL